MNTQPVVLFSAPASVGKTVAVTALGEYLEEEGIYIQDMSCKLPLHDLVINLFGCHEQDYWKIYHEGDKEAPNKMFKVPNTIDTSIFFYDLGIEPEGSHLPIGEGNEYILSLRQAMIYVSEFMVKPALGDDYFGKARLKYLPPYTDTIGVDDSCAFEGELPPLIDKVGQENILCINLTREGHTYEGDSRNYLPKGVIENTVRIDNNGTLEELFNKVNTTVSEFLKQRGVI